MAILYTLKVFARNLLRGSHTYVYITGYYNPAGRILTPVTLYVLIFIHKLRDLQFTVDSQRQIF